ncbi:MAG: hypothetical protein OEX81_00420 [Candidatus Pacebacteria bacterium]|nr:hypothetical protein [Candidatus Paceibacterota bacterium]
MLASIVCGAFTALSSVRKDLEGLLTYFGVWFVLSLLFVWSQNNWPSVIISVAGYAVGYLAVMILKRDR